MERTDSIKRKFWLDIWKGTLIIVLASQVNIELFTGGFRISAAVMTFPLLAMFLPHVPFLASALTAGPIVAAIRFAEQWVLQGSPVGLLQNYWPEAVFIIIYAVLFWGYCHKISLQPFHPFRFLPLIAIDTISNLLEILIRIDWHMPDPQLFLNLVVIASLRTMLTIILIGAVYSYGVKILSKKEAERYRQLILLTADLKNELVLMQKSGKMIENSMGTAYKLYENLKGSREDLADAALLIAKDIHEVKKEQALVLRGMDKALNMQSLDKGMYLREIWETIEPGISLMAKEMGKVVKLEFSCQDNLYTGCHYQLLSIFRNLLWNAVEAAGTDPVTVKMSQQQEGDTIIFRVSDSCGGISAEYLEEIFEPGFSTKINYHTGSVQRGLGLSMVKDLVETKLHGKITVQTGIAETVFTIVIPVKYLWPAEGQREEK